MGTKNCGRFRDVLFAQNKGAHRTHGSLCDVKYIDSLVYPIDSIGNPGLQNKCWSKTFPPAVDGFKDSRDDCLVHGSVGSFQIFK